MDQELIVFAYQQILLNNMLIKGSMPLAGVASSLVDRHQMNCKKWNLSQSQTHCKETFKLKIYLVEYYTVCMPRCQQTYGTNNVDQTVICADLANSNAATCNGDSGGPWTYNNQGTFELVSFLQNDVLFT